MPLNVDTFTCVGGLLHPWHFVLLLSDGPALYGNAEKR